MMATVTVYTTGPGCIRCTLTCRALAALGIDFQVVNLSTDPAAVELVTRTLGYSQAPVVVVGQHPDMHWSGFRPDLFTQLAARIDGEPDCGPTTGSPIGRV
ncbi:glutaredoxin family protein [Microbacterium albipurpureum]|uniref:glutaredoxin family protein n=1 Tax=Microbacterium albipurpureum TaxID=3050384 RepID=UPI003BF4ADCF